MIVVVNTNSFSTAYQNFILNTFITLAQQKSADSFIFLSTQPVKKIMPANCSTELIKQVPKSKIAKQYYYTFKVSTLLKKLKATHYFAADGVVMLRTKISQFSFLPLPINNKTLFNSFIKKYFNSSNNKKLSTVTKIITTSLAEKKILQENLSISTSKIEVLPISISPNYSPLFWENQQQIKTQYSSGLDFFFAQYNTITKQEFITLLKAFTKFKEWQKSSLQLLIHLPNLSLEIEKLYDSYKYKEDVKFITTLSTDEYSKLLASSYAFIFSSTKNQLAIEIVQAMHCQVPVICADNLKEVFNDLVVYANFTDIKSISNQLILLYKDEVLRNNLISTGFSYTNSLSVQSTIDRLWQILN